MREVAGIISVERATNQIGTAPAAPFIVFVMAFYHLPFAQLHIKEIPPLPTTSMV